MKNFLNKIKLLFLIFFGKKSLVEHSYKKLIEIIKSNRKKSQNEMSEEDLLYNIVSLVDKKAHDIMNPRVDIEAFAKDMDIKEILKIVEKSGYSRFPVFETDLDDIIGFIHVKDLLPLIKNKNPYKWKENIRAMLFVSPYMKLVELLFEMKATRNYMAIIVDEFGGVDGLITIEDIIEEIVGEITDEHDKAPDITIIKESPNEISVNAKIPLTQLEEIIGNFLSEDEREDNNTLSGLISSITGYIPSTNEVVKHSSGVEFRILSSTPIKINQVYINYILLDKTKE